MVGVRGYGSAVAVTGRLGFDPINERRGPLRAMQVSRVDERRRNPVGLIDVVFVSNAFAILRDVRHAGVLDDQAVIGR